jgi:3-methyladenine DNA glycosylase AlkD
MVECVKLEIEFLKLFKNMKPSYSVEVCKQYHGAGSLPEYESTLQFLGYKVPQTETVVKKMIEKNVSWEDLIELFVNSKIYEIKLACLLVFRSQVRKKLASMQQLQIFLRRIGSITATIDCWPLADTTSDILNQLLNQLKNPVLSKIDSLLGSKNDWQVRVGLVSLIYYTSPNRKPSILTFDQYLNRILVHCGNKHFYVQKGIGWQLRELGKAFPKPYEFWYLNEAHHLTSVAFSAASEKISTQSKAKVLATRKKQTN